MFIFTGSNEITTFMATVERWNSEFFGKPFAAADAVSGIAVNSIVVDVTSEGGKVEDKQGRKVYVPGTLTISLENGYKVQVHSQDSPRTVVVVPPLSGM